MAPKLGVLTIHGMGSQGQFFAEEMHRDIEKRVTKAGIAPNSLAYCPIYWADILMEYESELWEAMAKSELDWQPLRKFMIHNFADAIAYKRPRSQQGAKQTEIAERVRQKLRGFAASFDDNLPLVVVAHSLGAAIMSDYIWDRQGTQPAPGETKSERLDNIVALVTFGCNIPLFTLALPRVEPIMIPGPYVDPKYQPLSAKGLTVWHNFYDPDDVLGWPMVSVYGTRQDGRPGPEIRDYVINVGGIASSWNPKSHAEYWGDREFVGPVADRLAELVKVL